MRAIKDLSSHMYVMDNTGIVRMFCKVLIISSDFCGVFLNIDIMVKYIPVSSNRYLLYVYLYIFFIIYAKQTICDKTQTKVPMLILRRILTFVKCKYEELIKSAFL